MSPVPSQFGSATEWTGGPPSSLRVGYRTDHGVMYLGTIEGLLNSRRYAKDYEGKVDLIFTSPPFPLNRKKRYGNRVGQDYLEWLADLAPQLTRLLTPTGSIVIEVGNAWEPGHPVMSTLALQALLTFIERGELLLCEQFVCHNPARLPTPVQWVNVERIRVKDTFTHVWWMSPTERPKATNRNVLKKYSSRMRELLDNRQYNSGVRPSQHVIGEESFLQDNGGAIPSNVLTFANTSAIDNYRWYCREHGLKAHPARMPAGLAEFFIRFLTDPGDLVLDPFAGSNTTGAVAERLGRRWIAAEPVEEYVDGSRGRFEASRSR